MTACDSESFASLLERFLSVKRSPRVLDTGLAAMHVVRAELHHRGNGSITHHKTCLWHQEQIPASCSSEGCREGSLPACCWLLRAVSLLGGEQGQYGKEILISETSAHFSTVYHRIHCHYLHFKTAFGLHSCILYLLLWLPNFEGLETKELRRVSEAAVSKDLRNMSRCCFIGQRTPGLTSESAAEFIFCLRKCWHNIMVLHRMLCLSIHMGKYTCNAFFPENSAQWAQKIPEIQLTLRNHLSFFLYRVF